MESKLVKKPMISYVPSGLGKTSPPTCASSPSNINHISLDDEKLVCEQYEFGEKLGKGSFGVVWCVTHRPSQLKYACKTISKDKVQGQRIMKLIDREVKILKDVRHQHIIELKEVLETTQRIYLILELCEGGELSKLLQEHGSFTETETKVIMEQLARAISYLHKHGKVHRDLKLENILLSKREDCIENLCIKVTDFGLSIEKGGVGTDNMMDDYCGTPMYMAPEIIDFKSYSEKCDIWAMGVIMFKLLNGADDQRLAELTKGPGLRDRLADSQWSHLTDEVKDCLVGMMRWDPAHRLTADEVLDHPWMNGRQLDTTKPRNVLEMMKEFRDEKATGEVNDPTDHHRSEHLIVSLEHTSKTSKCASRPSLTLTSVPTVSRSTGPTQAQSVGTSNGRNSTTGAGVGSCGLAPSAVHQRKLHTSVSATALATSYVAANSRPAAADTRRLSIKASSTISRRVTTPPATKPSVVVTARTSATTTTNGIQVGTGRANRSSSVVHSRQKSS
jgi:serine/threonine kinase 33